MPRVPAAVMVPEPEVAPERVIVPDVVRFTVPSARVLDVSVAPGHVNADPTDAPATGIWFTAQPEGVPPLPTVVQVFAAVQSL